MIDKLKRIIFHPFLFAIYPPLFLLVNNLHELKFVSGLRAIMLCLLISTLLFFLLRFITKDSKRSALITSFTSILFFAYGPIHSLIPAYRVFGSLLTNQRFMLIFWGLIFILMIWLLGWKLRNPSGLNTFMNFAGAILISIVLVQAIIAITHKTYDQPEELIVQDISKSLTPPPMDERPDVYYIILDSYSRSDVLKGDFKIDNSDFIEGLTKRGFYVAECSHSNYPWTVYSLTSSLNMDFVPPVGAQFLDVPHSWLKMASYFRSNSVRNAFKDMGYLTVTFDTFYPWTNVTNSDIYISSRTSVKTESKPTSEILNILIGGVNDYEGMLMDMTPLVARDTLFAFLNNSEEVKPFNDELTGSIPADTENVGEQKILYDIYKYDLDHLGNIPSYPGKKFVYAHFFSVHRPFLFSGDGSFKPDQSYNGYANSITYTNKMLLQAIDQIIANSNPKPIIIIQGDHALLGSKDEWGILNAYYLPGIGQGDLYPTISPVNSFRVVFNQYFGGKFPLLPDLSFQTKKVINTFELLPTPVPNIPGCPK